MKFAPLTLCIASFFLILENALSEDIVNPLQDYYRSIENPSQLPSKTRVYTFEVDFTGNGSKSIFLTDDRCRLGPHGDYSWTVYYPVHPGRYSVADSFVDAGIGGPVYVGYIKEIQRFGAIWASKNGIDAQYLEGETVQARTIAEIHGDDVSAQFPKYLLPHRPNFHITTYTLAALEKRFGGSKRAP